jgi:hypothetical protein
MERKPEPAQAPEPAPEPEMTVTHEGAEVDDAEADVVPVPTGQDPQNEGAAETKASAAPTEEITNG